MIGTVINTEAGEEIGMDASHRQNRPGMVSDAFTMEEHAFTIEERGFTLVEVVLGMTVMLLCLMGLAAAVTSGTTLSAITSQEIAINNAVREKMAEMRSNMAVDFLNGTDLYSGLDSLIARYTAPGNDTFEIEGVEPGVNNGDPVAATGEVFVYLNEAQVPDAFDDSVNGIDLNGNGVFGEDLSVPADGRYDVNMAPVEVRVNFSGPDGRNIEIRRYMLVSRLNG